jgi:hypothetical protein
LPYLQQTEILLLQVLPIGWIALLGNIGFLYFGLLWKIMPFLAILPLTLYVALLLPAAHAWFTARRSVCSAQPR